MQYSTTLKEAILRRVLPPNDEPIAKVAREEGLCEQTIRNWIKQAGDSDTPVSGENSAEKWTSLDRFHIVVETLGMNETELGEYARQKGVFVEQINEWRETLMNCPVGASAKDIRRLTQEVKELSKKVRTLEKEVGRKEKALAEAAALLLLRKKAEAIWGESEDE